jgi:hypothetical protein
MEGSVPGMRGKVVRTKLQGMWGTASNHAQWFVSPRLMWFTVATFLLALAYAFWPPISEARITQAGVLLQLVGTGMGFRAWNATRRLFKMPSLMGEIRAWLKRRPLRNVTIQIAGGGLSTSSSAVNLSGWRAMGPDMETAARLDAMVANIEQLRDEAAKSNVAHTGATARLRNDMDSRTSAIEQVLSGTTRTLHESQTRGLWQAWVALLMLLVGTALAGSAAWSETPPTPAYAPSKAATESPTISDIYSIPLTAPDRRGTEQQPLVISKQAEDPEHVRNERITTGANVGLTALTAMLLLVNLWLIVEARRVSTRQASDTKRALEEQTRAADAMRDVADATKNNATLVQKIMQTQMRAYVSVTTGTATYQDDINNFASSPLITNTGLSPAKKVSTWIQADILDTTFPKDFKFQEPGVDAVSETDATLSAKQSFSIAGIVKERFNQDEVRDIMLGAKRRLFVWGLVTYEDVFGNKWETKFCHNFNFFKPKGSDDVKVESWYYRGHNNST